MTQAAGFWSYVHDDDVAEGGRIVRLAKDIVSKYELMTGDSIDLFLDREDINWGERWRDVIDASLAGVAFFIPVITPRYFQSAECRRELQLFARTARDLGVRELVMPLKYVDFPALDEPEPDDDLIALVKEFQWKDWTELSYADRTSEDYRRGVGDLANSIVEANRAAEASDLAASAAADVSEDEGPDAPGIIDRLGEMEDALPRWHETILEIADEIETVGSMMREATRDIEERDRRAAGMAGRIAVARQISGDLTPHANRILELGNTFTNQLHAVDGGVRTIIELAPQEIESDPERKREACEFFESVTMMVESSREGLGSLEGMIIAMQPLEQMSRDLRPPLRTLRKGLTMMHEGGSVIEEWLRLIKESPIECDDVDPPSGGQD